MLKPKPKASKPAVQEKPKTAPKKSEKPKDTKPEKERPQKEREPERERDDGADQPQTCPQQTHSFDPNTRVLMADGSTRPISEVNLDDKVATTDPVTGEHSAQKVTLLHANRDRELTNVTVSSASADQATRSTGEGEGERSTRGPTEVVLQTTAHHPFWDATTGTWVDAADLIPGTSTLVGPDGQLQYVTEVDNFTGAKVMRDLTVATTHTYYVIAGNEPVLVHNNDDEACPINPDGNRPEWGDNPEGPATKFDRPRQYSNMASGDRKDALNESPTCVYCGERPSTQADHVYPVKVYHSLRGWTLEKKQRSAEINQRGNLAGACQPCNGSKGGKLLGEGPGKWWPKAWPSGVYFPFGGGPK